MISGGTILVMIPVLMMKTNVETRMAMILIDAVYTARGLHTVCTAPTVSTADGAASAHDRNR